MIRHATPFVAARHGRAASTSALLYYQGSSVPRSLTSTGRVGTHRDLDGSDREFFGVAPTPTRVTVHDGRSSAEPFSLDVHGFERVDESQCGRAHIDYFSTEAVLNEYYADCEALVARRTGASRVIAFDHNLRARARKLAAERTTSASGAPVIQEPLISYGVHNDYTLESAPRRVAQLAAPATSNDTLRSRPGAPPPLHPDEVDVLLRGRWMFVNVWRNISAEPVQRDPLGLVDARTVAPEVSPDIHTLLPNWRLLLFPLPHG